MVCNRCVMVVQNIFEKSGLKPVSVSLGEVILIEDTLPEKQLSSLDDDLISIGFERVDDRKIKIIEKLKNNIITKIHHSDHVDVKYNWSAILSADLNLDYNYLSSLFSSAEGITLEQFIIKQKIERVKELLLYNELTLNQISDKLGYSSIQHLSTQFKKITGLTPSEYKRSSKTTGGRQPLDSL